MENKNTDTLCLSSTDTVNSNLNCKTYAGIDVWKFVMSFAVIAIHCQSLALDEYSGCINWFIRLAVPFFFIVSGFLLASKLEGMDTVSLKRALLYARFKQMGRLFFSWLIVYLPIAVYLAVINNTVWYRAVASYILQVLFYGHSAYAWPLWYVYSMAIVSYLLYKFFYKSQKTRIILAFTFVIAYIVAALVPTISFPSSLCSRTLGGGIFMLSGMYLYKYKGLIVNLKYFLASLFVSIILFTLNLPFYPLFGGIAIFVIALLIPIKRNKLTSIMRKQSMWNYYIHMYFVFICFEVSRQISVPLSANITFAIVSIAVFILSMVIVVITNRGYCVWLNKLVK